MTVHTNRIVGRRGMGRPRRQWYDDMREWTGNQLYKNIKQDHVTWRSVASRPQNGPQQPGWQGQQQHRNKGKVTNNSATKENLYISSRHLFSSMSYNTTLIRYTKGVFTVISHSIII